MDRPGGSRLERVLADFAEQHGVLSSAREQLRALSVTALSRDGAVEVTVDADGRAAGIRFVGRHFRDMTAPQLGSSVMDALTTARSEVEARAAAALATAGFRLPPSGPPVPVDGPAAHDPARERPVGQWTPGGADGAGVLRERARSRPQGPLWGRSRTGACSPAWPAPPPLDLREAVTALRAAVRAAVGDYGPPPAYDHGGAP